MKLIHLESYLPSVLINRYHEVQFKVTSLNEVG